jgi:hypothetical protein
LAAGYLLENVKVPLPLNCKKDFRSFKQKMCLSISKRHLLKMTDAEKLGVIVFMSGIGLPPLYQKQE